MHSFLRQNNIEFTDLAERFTERDRDPADIYWRRDPHFNRLGNRTVAEILLTEYPQIFGGARLP